MAASVIFGAGAIGGYIAAHLQNAGHAARLFARPATADRLRADGLTTTDGVRIAGSALDIETDPAAAFADAGRVLLCVKSTALGAAARSLAAHLPAGVPVFCLLNGLSPAPRLATLLPDHPVIAGMVPFNVAPRHDGLHQTSPGLIALAGTHDAQKLAGLLAGSPCAARLYPDVETVQAGKLLLNLNNPVNALSGLPVKAQLRDRTFRLCYAVALSEALNIYDAAGIVHRQVAALPAHKIARVLRWPNWAFNTLALPRQGLDEDSQTSMAQDLAQGRPTEIDTINGDLVAIARDHGLRAPVNEALVWLIKEAEAGGRKRWTGPELLTRITP